MGGSLVQMLMLPISCYLLLLVAVTVFQRKLIYIPTHDSLNSGLSEWRIGNQVIGYARKAESPAAVWLFMHGNAGQAAGRTYILPSFSPHDSVYILEYPGYGSRPGSPSMSSFNSAAQKAYEQLRSQHPALPVCVAAESIGTGPASFLATLDHPPDKITLLLPFDTFARVAARHYRILPVKLLLRDNWDNSASLRNYKGPLELFAARHDTIIPLAHAKALADSIPSAILNIIEGDHNDWSDSGKVRIRYESPGK